MQDSAVASGAVADADFALPLLLAIGLPLGALHERGTVHCGVRAGGVLCQLNTDKYVLWAAALEARSVDRVLALAKPAARAAAEQLLQSIIDDGLILRLGDTIDVETLLDEHRLLPTGVGIGNQADDEGACFIDGRIAGRRLRVDPVIYNVWGASTTEASLRDVVRVVAKSFGRDEREIGTHVVANLPVMMRTGTALLDLA